MVIIYNQLQQVVLTVTYQTVWHAVLIRNVINANLVIF